jgi:hypothetical protein
MTTCTLTTHLGTRADGPAQVWKAYQCDRAINQNTEVTGPTCNHITLYILAYVPLFCKNAFWNLLRPFVQLG